jgi:hypothetical protein
MFWNSIAPGPRSALPTIVTRPVCPSIISVSLSMQIDVVGPAGPTTSSRTGEASPASRQFLHLPSTSSGRRAAEDRVVRRPVHCHAFHLR